MPDIAGDWERGDGETRVTIEPCGQDLCAVNQWVKDPRSREKPGDVLVMSLQPAGSPTEFEGEAYDKRRDMTYALHLTLKDGMISIEGCVLFGLLCKSADWTRLPKSGAT